MIFFSQANGIRSPRGFSFLDIRQYATNYRAGQAHEGIAVIATSWVDSRTAMEVNINPRGNGACPLCTKETSCISRRNLAKANTHVSDPTGHGMEIVVYSCPQFAEKM